MLNRLYEAIPVLVLVCLVGAVCPVAVYSLCDVVLRLEPATGYPRMLQVCLLDMISWTTRLIWTQDSLTKAVHMYILLGLVLL